MIGQEKLLSQIEQMKSIPHSILLIGDHDAGHEQIVKRLSEKAHAELIDITELLTRDLVDQMNMQTNITMYFINLSKVTEKNQNMLLKVLEEPSNYTYLVLYCEQANVVIPTVMNRSYVLKMEKYSKELLAQYAYGDYRDFILEICTTPKQVETACATNMSALINLCDAIVNKMRSANFDNALTISDKINFGEDYDKFDLYLFYKVLSKYCIEHGATKVYDALRKMMNFIYLINDKKHFFEHFIIDLWKESRS